MVLGGWSQLRMRKAAPQQKELLLEIGSEGVRPGLDEPIWEVCGEDSSLGGVDWKLKWPLRSRALRESKFLNHSKNLSF